SRDKRPTDWSTKEGDKPSVYGDKTTVYVYRRGKLPELSGADKARDEEMKRLAGTWKQVSFMDDGQQVPLPKNDKTRLTISSDGKFTVKVAALRVSPIVGGGGVLSEGKAHFEWHP